MAIYNLDCHVSSLKEQYKLSNSLLPFLSILCPKTFNDRSVSTRYKTYLPLSFESKYCRQTNENNPDIKYRGFCSCASLSKTCLSAGISVIAIIHH